MSLLVPDTSNTGKTVSRLLIPGLSYFSFIGTFSHAGSFTPCYICEIHSCCFTWLWLVHSHYCMVFHYMNIQQFIHFTVSGHIDYFLFGAINTAVNVWICLWCTCLHFPGTLLCPRICVCSVLAASTNFPQRMYRVGSPQQCVIIPGAEHSVSFTL